MMCSFEGIHNMLVVLETKCLFWASKSTQNILKVDDCMETGISQQM